MASDQDELRDRVAEVISSATTGWVRDEYVTDLSEGDYIAQAIIDEFGMTMETNAAVEGPRPMRRVIGEWEWA